MEAAAFPAPNNTEGFVVRKSDVNAADVDEWKQQGYFLSEETDDGNFVFILNRPPESIDVDSILPGFILESLPLGKVDSGIDLKGGDDGVPILKWEKKGLPSHMRGKDNRPVIHGTTGQRPNFRLGFAHACDRSDPDKTILKLKLYNACVCVDGSKNIDTERGHFVWRLVVSASPAAKWRAKVTNVSFSPPAKRVTIAREETKSVTVSASANPKLGGAATNSTKYEIDNHVWNPATLDDKTESVTWEWQLNSWGNGESLNPQGWNFFWGIRGELPELPFDNTKLVTIFDVTNVESLQGDWEVSNDDLVGIETIDWDITVNVCTLSVRVKSLLDRVRASKFKVWDMKRSPFQTKMSFKLT